MRLLFWGGLCSYIFKTTLENAKESLNLVQSDGHKSIVKNSLTLQFPYLFYVLN